MGGVAVPGPRRSSATWLVVLVLIVAAALAASVVLPFKTCPTCRGLYFRKVQEPAGHGPAVVLDIPVDCVDCGEPGATPESCVIRHSGHVVGVNKSEFPAHSEIEGVCRVAIHNDRFFILAPSRAQGP